MIHNQTKFPFNSNIFLDRQAGLPIENEMDWDNHDGRSRPYQFTWVPSPNTNVGNNFIFSATRDGQLHAGHGIEPGDWIDLYIGSIPYPFEVLSIENNHEIRIDLNGLTGPFSGFKKRIYPGMNFDPDALNFIYRVEQQDGQKLENTVRFDYNWFVVKQKTTPSGVSGRTQWQSMQTGFFALHCGQRSLAGSLIPLTGPAPTNINFVTGDYSRTQGLKGDGASKSLTYPVLGSNLPNTDRSIGLYHTQHPSRNVVRAHAGNGGLNNNDALQCGEFSRFWRLNGFVSEADTLTNTGYYGASKTASGVLTTRYSGTSISGRAASGESTLSSSPMRVFARQLGSGAEFYSDGRTIMSHFCLVLDMAALESDVAQLQARIITTLS